MRENNRTVQALIITTRFTQSKEREHETSVAFGSLEELVDGSRHETIDDGARKRWERTFDAKAFDELGNAPEKHGVEDDRENAECETSQWEGKQREDRPNEGIDESERERSDDR